MRLIKKIDIFVFKAYTLLFVGTFFVCLFIFMMQFMWRWVEDLIGKGLTLDVLAHFFYYVGLTLIPMSLPLAILLASLITFGNFGERFELLSMKAAGIPLIRIFQPIIIFTVGLSICSFYFQNVVSPDAQKKFYTLAYSMKQKSPELEIPEGIFYNEIPGYNIFVEHKGKDNGMLYGVMIYSTTDGYEDSQIVLADSARLQSTEDEKHLKLTMYAGERFRNMQSQGGVMQRTNVPYMRETFVEETDLIPFDNNFNVMDANLFNGSAVTKNMREIQAGIDSLNHKSDSTGTCRIRQPADNDLQQEIEHTRRGFGQDCHNSPRLLRHDIQPHPARPAADRHQERHAKDPCRQCRSMSSEAWYRKT